MWHSGTLAAANRRSCSACAGSPWRSVTTGEPDFEALKQSVEDVLKLILPAPDLTLVNVNFPEKRPMGLRWTRQSVRHYDGKVVPGEDPMGRKHFRFVVTPIEETEERTTAGPSNGLRLNDAATARPDERGGTGERMHPVSARSIVQTKVIGQSSRMNPVGGCPGSVFGRDSSCSVCDGRRRIPPGSKKGPPVSPDWTVTSSVRYWNREPRCETIPPAIWQSRQSASIKIVKGNMI